MTVGNRTNGIPWNMIYHNLMEAAELMDEAGAEFQYSEASGTASLMVAGMPILTVMGNSILPRQIRAACLLMVTDVSERESMLLFRESQLSEVEQ